MTGIPGRAGAPAQRCARPARRALHHALPGRPATLRRSAPWALRVTTRKRRRAGACFRAAGTARTGSQCGLRPSRCGSRWQRMRSWTEPAQSARTKYAQSPREVHKAMRAQCVLPRRGTLSFVRCADTKVLCSHCAPPSFSTSPTLAVRLPYWPTTPRLSTPRAIKRRIAAARSSASQPWARPISHIFRGR